MDTIDINTMFGPMPAAASDLSVDELTALMKRHGVIACGTLSTLGILLDHNAGNASTRAACAENPNLIPVATFNPLSYFGGEGPYGRFAEDGFKIVRFFPAMQGWEVDSVSFLSLVQQLRTQRLPIMVDVDRPGVASRLLSGLGEYPAAIILAGIDERTVAEAVAIMRAHDNVRIETSHLLATGAMKHVIACVGADRLLYGSGAPSRPMASVLGVVRFAGLSEDESGHILGGNAKKLLGM